MSIPLKPDPKEVREAGVLCTKRGPQSWGITWPTKAPEPAEKPSDA